MRVSPQVHEAFDRCFDAVIGLAGWGEALQELGGALGAESSVLIPGAQDFGARYRRQVESTEHAAFSAIWLAHIENPLSDPHSIRARRFPIARAPCVTDDQIITTEERARLPYFNEVARPGQREWWAMLRAKTDRQAWCLNLYRGARGGPYTPEEAARVSRAEPLLRRLTAMAERFAETGWNARLESFELLRLGGFLVDREARVLGMNAAGAALLGKAFGLVRKRLITRAPLAQAALARFLRTVADGIEPPAPVVLTGVEEVRWLIEFVPVSDRSAEIFSGAKGLIIVSEIAGRPASRNGLLRQAFSLTPAEERLALILADGRGLGAACMALGIGLETARSQLHAVFDKTGARSQAQLSVLLTRFTERLQVTPSPPNG